ncbi:MAG: 3-deoxy-8-phosphooctulonate synthase, partial [Flavobacteriaceae bacterium]|nr:3-deoxy-8-phosphooctulonate synthase [Flavobacteriaceae bacterium]
MIDNIPNIKNTNSDNFFLIAGPCAIEGEEMAFKIAEKIFDITNKLEIPFIFKGSFKKANRSRID